MAQGLQNKLADDELPRPPVVGPMKRGLSVGRRLEILHYVRRRLGNETVSVGLKWSVKCRVTNSECRCRATLIILFLVGCQCPMEKMVQCLVSELLPSWALVAAPITASAMSNASLSILPILL